MSKLYIYSTTGRIKAETDILELGSTIELKSVYKKIKASIPKASVGVYGAKDFDTLQRTHRNLGRCKLTKSVDKFMAQLYVR